MESYCTKASRKFGNRNLIAGFRTYRSYLWCLAIALILLVPEVLNAGTTLSGKVHDPDGRPLDNVSITNLERNLKTLSNVQGEFAPLIGGESPEEFLRKTGVEIVEKVLTA